MLITNILLGVIIFFMVIISGGICNIDKKLNGVVISNAEIIRLKKLSDSLMKQKGKGAKDYPVSEE